MSVRKKFPGELRLCLRAFSIMEDIPVVYTWINRTRPHCSGHLLPYQTNLLRYYKTNLDSSSAQSLMVLQSNRQLCQIDLFPAIRDPAHASFATSSNDTTLKYLADPRITPSALRHALQLCLDYIFSFSGTNQVLMSTIDVDERYRLQLREMGFEHLETLFVTNETLRILRYLKQQ